MTAHGILHRARLEHRRASHRYGDLQRELGAPTNILATRLRELQAGGLLYRLPLAHNQRAYALTERGAALRPAIEALARWATAGPQISSPGNHRNLRAPSPLG